MLNDADFTQFKHVYVFVGKTDLRKGIDGLATLVKQKFSLDRSSPETSSCFADQAAERSKTLSGRKMDSFRFINDWKQAPFSGPDRLRKPGT
jgi:hypothetical protein